MDAKLILLGALVVLTAIYLIVWVVMAMKRRAELSVVRDATRNAAVADAPATFLGRMKRFLRL